MDTLNTIRPELLTISKDQFISLSPYFWIFGGAIVTLILAALKWLKPKWPVFIVTLLIFAAGACSSYELIFKETIPLFNGMMVSDSFSNCFIVLFLSTGFFTALSSFRYLDKEDLQFPEYYILLLFSALGMMLMASTLDLLVIFIALELMSLAIYALVGFRRSDKKSNEAAMKYFILGSAASAVLLYGTALLYGVTGSTGIKNIFAFTQAHPESMNLVFALGSSLVLFGFLFKVASVPFHMWMPDVYEGAPTPVTGFMTTGLKAAAFAAFIRVFVSLGYGTGASDILRRHIHDILWVSAVLTMFFGNVIALTQVNLKRMLAYSSIAHTGYLLIGILAGSKSGFGYAPSVLYLAVYSIMNLGAFVILGVLSNRGDTGLNLPDFSGLSRRHPWLAFSLAVFLFSMSGIPPTAGFVSKYLLFYSAVQAGEIPLVILGVLCSTISVFYYLRVLVFMFMKDPVGAEPQLRVSFWSGFAVASMVILTVLIGILPSDFIELARQAISSI